MYMYISQVYVHVQILYELVKYMYKYMDKYL